MQVQVHKVETHVAGTRHAHDRVQVRAVIVVHAARLAHNAGDFEDVFVKQTQRVGVCEHESGGVVAHKRAQRFHVHAAVRRGRHRHNLEAGHRGAGGIGAVRRIGHDDLRAPMVAAAQVIGAHHQHAREFAVRAGAGLKRHVVHAGDFGQVFLRQRQRVRAAGRVLRGMRVRKAGQRGHGLVHLRVVFHRAASERIEAVAHAERGASELRVVAAHLAFRDAGKLHFRFTGHTVRGAQSGNVQRLQHPRAFSGALVNQLHARTSFAIAAVLSSSSRVFASVTHHRTPPSTGRPPRMPFSESAASSLSG